MSEINNFNWSDKNAPVIIQPVAATAIYRNPDGDIVIRQRGDMNEEDECIVIHKDYLKALIQALQDELDKTQ